MVCSLSGAFESGSISSSIIIDTSACATSMFLRKFFQTLFHHLLECEQNFTLKYSDEIIDPTDVHFTPQQLCTDQEESGCVVWIRSRKKRKSCVQLKSRSRLPQKISSPQIVRTILRSFLVIHKQVNHSHNPEIMSNQKGETALCTWRCIHCTKKRSRSRANMTCDKISATAKQTYIRAHHYITEHKPKTAKTDLPPNLPSQWPATSSKSTLKYRCFLFHCASQMSSSTTEKCFHARQISSDSTWKRRKEVLHGTRRLFCANTSCASHLSIVMDAPKTSLASLCDKHNFRPLSTQFVHQRHCIIYKETDKSQICKLIKYEYYLQNIVFILLPPNTMYGSVGSMTKVHMIRSTSSPTAWETVVKYCIFLPFWLTAS